MTPPSQLAVPKQLTPPIPHYTNAPTYNSQPDDNLPSPSDAVPWNSPSDSSAWLTDNSRRGFPAAREPRRESTWYTRQDYFHWNERLDGSDFVTEDGLLLTLGYQRRTGIERFRVEAFGGTMTATSDIPIDDVTVDHNRSQTGYMGARVEYDLLWEPVSFPSLTLYAGIGSRFWFRDLRDDITNSGVYLIGYQETWWTFYPYVGGEKRWTPARGWEFYLNGRIGLTPVTWEHVTYDDVTLHPSCGLTGNAETGLRWNHLFVAAYWEAMTWNESTEVRDSWQPMSRMYVAGLKSGWTF